MYKCTHTHTRINQLQWACNIIVKLQQKNDYALTANRSMDIIDTCMMLRTRQRTNSERVLELDVENVAQNLLNQNCGVPQADAAIHHAASKNTVRERRSRLQTKRGVYKRTILPCIKKRSVSSCVCVCVNIVQELTAGWCAVYVAHFQAVKVRFFLWPLYPSVCKPVY